MKIPININDAYANQHGKDDFSKLFDGDIKTQFTVWNNLVKPFVITFPFYNLSKCVIKQLSYVITNGNPSTQKYYYIKRDTGEKVLFFAYSGGIWYEDNRVRVFDVPASLQADASAFIIESMGGDDFPSELSLDGDFTLKDEVLPAIQRSPLSKLLGAVVAQYDISNWIFPEKQPGLLMLGVTRVRFYNHYIYVFNKDTKSLDNNGWWRWTESVKLLKGKGIDVQMDYLNFPYYPFPTGEVRTDPQTYLQLAKDIQWFGKNNVDNGEPINVIEVGNEMNAWYGNNPQSEYMDGYAIAAMLSICKDGHKGKYPVGLRASGTKALLSTPGLAEGEPYLFYQMAEWCEKNRGRNADGTIDFPFDVYSFHCYSSLQGQRSGTLGGVAPEIGMVPYMKKINEVRKRLNKNIKIHIGEWGWDIHPDSQLNAPAFSGYSAHQVSAMWTARALLLMAEHEMDASSYYRIGQDQNADDNNSTIFATMALWRVGNETNPTKNPDGSITGLQLHPTLTGEYYMQVGEILKQYEFDSRVSDNVLKFKNATSELYAVWETENMTVVNNKPVFTEKTGSYSLNAKGKLRRFSEDGSGVMITEDFLGTVKTGSRPVFIEVDSSVTPVPVPPPVPIEEYKRKGYWVIDRKRVYYKVFKTDGNYQIKTGDYTWYKSAP